jgi:hypothetical protein
MLNIVAKYMYSRSKFFDVPAPKGVKIASVISGQRKKNLIDL